MEVLKNTTYSKIVENMSGENAAIALNAGLGHVFGSEQYDFTQDDISSYTLTYAHGYNTRKLFAKLYDNNWIEQTTIGIFTVTDANNWTLNVDNAITGTWHLIIDYRP